VAGKPFFSVVIPLYNKAPHIARSVGSVLNQTFPDFELIIVNDASTDNGVEEVQKFSDPRIRLLHRGNPGPGGYAARNLGIKEAHGEWVAFLDADDEWYPEHLEMMHALSVQFPDIYFMGCGWEQEEKNVRKVSSYFERNSIRGNHVLDVMAYLDSNLKNQGPVWTSVACVKVTSPVTSDLFPSDTPAQRGGDLHAWLKMICYHKRMAWSSHVGAVYFKDSVNMVTKTAPSSPFLMRREVYHDLADRLSEQDKILLRKYLNMQLRKVWIRNLRSNRQSFNLIPQLYWSGNAMNALAISCLAILPSFVIKAAILFRSRLRSND
jgi:glycosyltransferase involved in cell wall biosynthesis